MKAEWLSPERLEHPVVQGLFESAVIANCTFKKFCWQIFTGDLKVFVVGEGTSACYMAVSVLQHENGLRELQLDALWVETAGQGWRFRTYLAFLKKLALAWDCDFVGTAVSNQAQLAGLLSNGCVVEYTAVRLEIHDEEKSHSDHEPDAN